MSTGVANYSEIEEARLVAKSQQGFALSALLTQLKLKK